MATEAHKLQVGIFVIAATLIGVGTAIWLGASRFFENTSLMVTYFSESVQGLEPGSAVKYRGVPAGRVRAHRHRAGRRSHRGGDEHRHGVRRVG